MNIRTARSTSIFALTAFAALVAGTGCSAILGLDEFGAGGQSASQGTGGGASSSRAGSGTSGSGASSGSGSVSGSGSASGSGSVTGSGSAVSSTSDASSVQSSGNGITCDQPSSCIPEAPVGFSGPYLVQKGAPGAPPPCLGAFDQTLRPHFTGLDEGTPSCSCSCGDATGIQCPGGAGYCFTSNCVQFCNPVGTIPQGGCNLFPAAGTNINIFPPAPTAHGSCQPSLTSNIPAPTWNTQYAGCGSLTLTGDGCGADELCVPPAVGDFQTRCVVASGDQVCPSHYTEKRLLNDGFTDGRSCSACSCGNATSQCGGAVTFMYNSCNFFESDVSACAPFNAPLVEEAAYFPNPTGSCPPSGGNLQGSVTVGAQVTFCCEP